MTRLKMQITLTLVVAMACWSSVEKQVSPAAASELASLETTSAATDASPIPIHCRVIWTTDPATSALVSWSTTQPAPRHTIRYWKKGSPDDCVIIKPTSGRFTGQTPELYFHHARLSNLEPDTTYEFQIGSDGQFSKEMYFVTAPRVDRPFSILHGGDSRSDHVTRRRVNQMMSDLVTESYANGTTSDDIIAFAHGGDYVATGKNLEQWNEWLSDHELTQGPDGRQLPIIPARGNHDTGELFNQVFGFPAGDKNYFAIDLGPVVRFVTLNTEISTAGEQAKWLAKELGGSRPVNRWLLAQYHRPAFPAVKTPGAALQSWVPMFEKFNVDLVCEADGHNIKRTVPIRGNVRDESGVIYIGEGGLGVAQRTPKKNRWYLQPPGMSDSASHVFVLNFGQDQLSGRCVRLDRTLADEFQIPSRKIETAQAFLVTGDPQYLAENVAKPSKLDPYSAEANSRFLDILKKLPGESIPAAAVGGSVSKKIKGVLVTGDLIDSADKNGGNYPAMQRFEWERYKTDYGLTGKDGGLPYPVYELHGNHDGPQGDTFIVEDIVKRNATRPGVVNKSANGLHYSWDWGPLHLVSLGIFVGEGQEKREQFHYAPRGSLEFLAADLESQVGDSGRPVILAFHLHPNGPEYDWPPEDLQQFWNALKKYNVIAMFHGHTHGSPPSRMQWLGDQFGSELAEGIDFFNPDDSAAAKTNPQDAANPIGLAHGFLYVEMLDRPGQANDELIVRSVLTKDNWATRSWGKTWRKAIQIPAKKK